MSAANRNRGARAEVAVVNYLRGAGWPDTRRYLAGDGRQPGDIDWHPLVCVEVKDRQASSWPSWCRQTAQEARGGTVPVVVRRTRGTPDVGLWRARTRLSDLTEHMWGTGYDEVDGETWVKSTFAEVVAAVRAVDAEVTS